MKLRLRADGQQLTVTDYSDEHNHPISKVYNKINTDLPLLYIHNVDMKIKLCIILCIILCVYTIYIIMLT